MKSHCLSVDSVKFTVKNNVSKVENVRELNNTPVHYKVQKPNKRFLREASVDTSCYLS